MINKIISFSINNKPAIWLMTAALIIGGLYSMTKIPLDAVPDITNNQVLVITTAPNLGTEDIEQFVTYRVELAVANLPGVVEIRSISRFGLSVVTIVFKDEAGTFLPRQLVSEALADIKEKIPEGFGRPFMAPISTGLGEIYQYTLEVDPKFDTVYDDMKLRTIQDWIVKRQMAMLPGVVEVNSFGGRMKQYEVAVDPDKLRSMNLTITDIYNALKKNNRNTGGAYIEKNHRANFIRGEGLMRSLDEIRNTPVTSVMGQPVFIRDVAEVKHGSFVRYGAFTKNGKGEAVGGIVMMLKGENSNQVIARVKERVAEIQKSLPPGITIKPFLDRSKLIKSTTNTVAENLVLGALIVIFVLVFFLGNLRGGLIVASTIPLAMLFAFIMMHLFGVWANLMSLGALDFGILVDGAVIIVESMIFYLHKKEYIGIKLSKEKRDKLAFKSSGRMMNSAFFGQLIILIVFIPVMALQGVEGKMFKPMAMTFGFAVLGVVILCLTYIPMMTATFLQPPKTDKKNAGDKVIAFFENLYRPVIAFSIKRSSTVLIVALILLLSGGWMFSRMGAEFMPQLDEGDFAFQAFLKPGTSLTEVKDASTKIEKIVLENFPDEVESIQSRIGVADLPMDPMPMDIADFFVILKPKEQWKRANTKKELIDKVKEKVSVLPGINYEFTQPIEMRFNELLTGIREDVAIKLYGDDLNVLADKATEIAGLITGIDGVAGVKAEATRGLPQITVNYNRQMLGRYGLNIDDVNLVIESAFSGGVASNIYEGEKMFDLVVRLDEKHRKDIDNVRNLFISLPDGNQIPLKEIAEISYKPGPMQISRDNTNRRTYVGVNVEDRDIKSLVNEIKKTLDDNLTLPPGYYIRYGGAFENFERATARLTFVVPLALLLIFVLVFFAVKSFKQTLMIYVAIPFAAVGGIFSLYFRDMPFSISAGVGFIVLFGVAVLNGLVLVNGFNQLKKEGGFSINEILLKGSVRRIRPILLTASTDILGFLPMAVSTSAGAEVQRPLATVVIGGMITSTLLTLVVLPLLYKITENMKRRKTGISKTTMPATVLLMAALLLPGKGHTQTTVYTLDEAVKRAVQVFPSIKAAGFEVEKQQALKNTAWDFGTTSVYTGVEEATKNVTGIRNNIGVGQSGIDLFSAPSKNKLGKANIHWAETAKELTVLTVQRDVRKAWFQVYQVKKRRKLYYALDSLYSRFQKAAKLRYETGQTSKIEYLSALSLYRQLQIDIKTAENDYKTSLEKLNFYLRQKHPFDISDNIDPGNLFVPVESDTVNSNVVLDYYSARLKVSEQQINLFKTAFLPKVDIGYVNQTLDGITGYYGWQAGISMPLIFVSQKAKVKAAKMDYAKTGEQLMQKKSEINMRYKNMMNSYLMLLDAIAYYEKEAVPLANEQIRAANTAYRLGSIDYVQYIQNVSTAIKTKLDFMDRQLQLMNLSAELFFLTSNN
jgi:cobalt-zinc-cadmium resistance protein CzcA